MRTSKRTILLKTALVATTAISLGLIGCTAATPLAERYQQDNERTGSADGRIVEIPVDERGAPVSFTGTTEYGDPIASDDYAGQVYVVNFWYAACGPCIVEAPMLEEIWQKYQDDGVGFLGVNIYDQPATAVAFAEDNGITYPSVIDVTDGRVKQAFAGVTPIQATPTTLVLDREGRVAARIIGQLESASILDVLVSDALEETT
ncbi:Redoxin domain protein precursor [Micrococcus luteus]|uniref:TlpA family protein disulfide reductase n=1 Tax=Nesterenkonia massiliensis TaxID=1232429 RepID=A0ABT2HQJ0_9MICC|nr:TlpA disulfide reductase family protein [Nesterenkonia alba]EZP32910.1 Redoxin domain protein precursor [Micrococcus luteus]MCT1606960.1 TlpA family protein disulfide reductase [Nesterenkonia massiliensis]CVN70944.1 thioredoxin [Streptococcus pneumoniae]